MTRSAIWIRQVGRRSLAWAAWSFLGIQVVIGLILDYAAPQVRFPACGELRTMLRAQPEPPTIVTFGSSRLGLAFDAATAGQILRARVPECHAAVFNACICVGDPLTSDFIGRQVLAEGCRPRVVLIEVCPESVSWYNEWLAHDIAWHLRAHDLPGCLGDILAAHAGQQLLWHRCLPVLAYRRQFLDPLLGMPPAEERPPVYVVTGQDCEGLFGRTLSRLRWSGPRNRGEEDDDHTQQMGRWLSHFRIGGASARALERLIARCRERGAKVLLVGVPLRSDLRQLYHPAIESLFHEYLEHLRQRFGCRFIDLRDFIADADFLDDQHVAPPGTDRFTRRLTEEVLSVLAQR